MKFILYYLITPIALFSCKKNITYNNPITPGITTFNLEINKAVYIPGEAVSFKLNALPASSFVRYRYLNDILREDALTGTTWSWSPPATDFRAYSVELFIKENGIDKTLASTAIDVSSDWSKFPRYGFLSEFGQISNGKMDSVISSLTRYHINGLQFYDWMEKHHKPLAGTVSSPSDNWQDIAKRPIYKATVEGYITKAHSAGMKAMSYNLCYGALNDALSDGVQESWYMYKDATHTTKAVLDLPGFLKSPIYLLDPSNTNWQQYIAARNNDMYAVYNFDGYHIDQLGDWGTVYNYNGGVINLANSFNPFIQSMKTLNAGKRLVFNAVNQFGQQGSIATAPVDFLYSEVWGPNENYSDLATFILNNNNYSSNSKKTVLAAYMNYNKANNPGTFNTPGVLLTNAVIFAFGGSHIELGEHMLGKEYFPNSNLQMNDALKKAIVVYYDFLTAYQNLLRDGGTFNSPSVSCTNGKMNLSAWPPQNGKVAFQGKLIGSKQVLHFINFANASTFDWRDTNGTQTTPSSIGDANIEVNYSGTATKVWVASPDINFGIPQQLSFTQNGNVVKFTLPSLQYWDMIVIE